MRGGRRSIYVDASCIGNLPPGVGVQTDLTAAYLTPLPLTLPRGYSYRTLARYARCPHHGGPNATLIQLLLNNNQACHPPTPAWKVGFAVVRLR